MTAGPEQAEHEDLPAPVIHNRRWIPRLVWLVPIAAAALGISLLARSWAEQGPHITISFLSGEGIEAGKTLVKYRDVTVGRVSAVTLSADHQTVLVSADLVKSASTLVHEDTTFWVVRPRIGVGWASGLDTLLSGAYIGMQTGVSTRARHQFVGLENPPPLAHGPHGTLIELRAPAAGSLASGAPVYFRHFQVGRVIDENLLGDGSTRVSVFIDAPYDQFVKADTRFWNASGVSLSLTADGLQVRTESLATVLAGGIAFDDGPPDAQPTTSGPRTRFTLYDSETEAMAPPNGNPAYVRMRFAQALRGLEVGAPVEFRGVKIGTVAAVDLDYDARSQSFPVIVTAKLYPQRMGRAYETLAAQGTTENEDTMAAFVATLVARGLRAQPRSGSLLTGQLFIALDFFPGSPRVAFNPKARPLELPTVTGTYQELEAGMARLVTKLNELPLQRLANQVNLDLTDLHGSLGTLNREVLPDATTALSALHGTLDSARQTVGENSPLVEGLSDTLSESQATLVAVRELADYLDRHPEALLRGRRHESAPRRALNANGGGNP
ncbi:MAG: PqiB family protein [Steroidobacteraceae bacterium]